MTTIIVPTFGPDLLGNPLDNWAKSAIFADVERRRSDQLERVRVACPWCTHGKLIVARRERGRTVTGRALCDHCGEFFRWLAHNGAGTTRRIRAKPKRFRGRDMARGFTMDEVKKRIPEVYHLLVDGSNTTLRCGAPIVPGATTADGITVGTGITDNPEHERVCSACKGAT